MQHKNINDPPLQVGFERLGRLGGF